MVNPIDENIASMWTPSLISNPRHALLASKEGWELKYVLIPVVRYINGAR
jgi:hypothetical protein